MANIPLQNGGVSKVDAKSYKKLHKYKYWACEKCGHIIRVDGDRTRYQACDVLRSTHITPGKDDLDVGGPAIDAYPDRSNREKLMTTRRAASRIHRASSAALSPRTTD